MTPAYFVDYKLSLPNRGTDYVCSHTRDSVTLLVTQTFGLPFYSNQLSLSLYSCYLMKLLYNMFLLPSDAHSDVINQHCRSLPVLCRALIVLLLMISGNVHVHPGPSTAPTLTCALISASLISALLIKAWVFSMLSLEAYYLKWIN